MKLPSTAGRLLVALAVSIGLGTVAVTSSAVAAPDIRHAGGPTAVPNSYIVVLADEIQASAVEQTAIGLAATHGGVVGSVWQHALRGFSVTMPEAAARKLAASPAVSYVEQNHTVSIADTQLNPPSWGLDRIDQRDLPLDDSYTYPNDGSGVHAYIIDTGIRITHNDFDGRASHGYDFVDDDPDASDCNGHGTHVAGTVGGTDHGVAKGVQLVGVRVLDCGGSGTFQGVIDGVDWVTANAALPAVANMSLGASGSNSSLEDAVTNSIDSGVSYAIAAGNSDADACNFTPARTPDAITVGATDSSDNRASFSNWGTCLDIFAPGVSITSAWIGSDSDTNTISGTSMAAPHVAGAAALILSANPGFTAQEVRDTMVANATPDVVNDPGSGSPNLLLFVGGDEPPPPPPPGDCIGTNDTDVAIPDHPGPDGTSSITISDCGRNASSVSTVEVHVVHPFRGGLVITLVAPDGTTYLLKDKNNRDRVADVHETYTVDLSSEAADGTWVLHVDDQRKNDTGYIDSWTLTV